MSEFHEAMQEIIRRAQDTARAEQGAEIERLKDHLVAQALVRVQLEAKCNDLAAKLAAANVERWEPVEDDFSYEEADLHTRLEMRGGEFLLLRNRHKTLGAIVLPNDVRLCRRHPGQSAPSG